MNVEKAREYFSLYREGSLEGGLKIAFEQKLDSDRNLQAEFQSFQNAMDELDSLKFEEIPVPMYLNARIHARLDEARKPQRQGKGLVFYLPRFGIAAAAAAAILFAAASVLRPGHGSSIQSSIVSSDETQPAPPSESVTVEAEGSAVKVHYSSATERAVTIKDASGKVLRQDVLEANKPFESELKNSNSSAAVFEVQVSDQGPDEFIAVPGSMVGAQPSDQSGTVLEFAQALATRYCKPVIYSGHNIAAPLNWNLSQSDAKTASDQVLEGTKLVESITSTGVLSISDR